MTETARIIVISGPARGKAFEPEEELVHIGKGEENQIVIDDPGLADHHASIVRRNGRYAIYTPEEGTVEVDGSVIPSEKWIWLPETVKVQLGKRTTFVFSTEQVTDGGEAAPATAPVESRSSGGAATGPSTAVASRRSSSRDDALAVSPLKARSHSKKKKKSRRSSDDPSKKSSRQVAKFITAQGGDTLVKLGEDGHMPELTLTEATGGKTREKKPKQSNPAMLYVALGVSLLLTTAMLFIDSEPGRTSSAAEKSRARQQIKEFYGKGTNLDRYQELLRQAELFYHRRDFTGARRNYRRVLDMLNSEDNKSFTGLTGTQERDAELKRLLTVLLAN